jgi:site-specific DNA-methyltransferase (adenine-specific)
MSSWKDIFPIENRYFETENGILYCGNCLEVMYKIPDKVIDLIVTSPPYNVGIDYDKYQDNLPVEEYFAFVRDFLRLYKKVLKKDGRFAINILYDINMKHTGKVTRISPVCEYYNLLKEVGLNYNSIVDLVEPSAQRVKLTAWGSWLKCSSPYQYNPKECVLIGYNEVWKKQTKGISTMTKEEFIEIVGGVWKYNTETRGLTKANFSRDIPDKAIKGLTYKDDIVLDSFFGSGTTGVSCEELGRKWIGIELSERYCEIAKRRISEQNTNQK